VLLILLLCLLSQLSKLNWTYNLLFPEVSIKQLGKIQKQQSSVRMRDLIPLKALLIRINTAFNLRGITDNRMQTLEENSRIPIITEGSI
jgi:hypothetical protein